MTVRTKMLASIKLVSEGFEVTKAVMPLLRFTLTDGGQGQSLTGTLTVNYAGYDADGFGYVFSRLYLINAHTNGYNSLSFVITEIADASTAARGSFTLAVTQGVIGQTVSPPGPMRAPVTTFERIAFDYIALSAKSGGAPMTVELLQGAPQ